MLSLTQCLLDTPPFLHSTQPLPPSLPNLLKVPTLSLLRNARAAFEVVKHPESVSPRSKHNIDQCKVLSKEERTFRIHLAGEFFEMIEKLNLLFLQTVFTLVLEESVVSGDDAGTNIY